jgi:methyl halide transferase
MPTPQSSPDPHSLSPEFWEERYQDGSTRWDLGQPAPPFVTLLAAPDAPSPGRMAVLGAGRGHDALLFAEQGFEVVGFDFAPSAIAAAVATAEARGLTAQFLQRDIFALGAEFAHQFDYVLEHTCYCAILPAQRADYVSWCDRFCGRRVNSLPCSGRIIGLVDRRLARLQMKFFSAFVLPLK